MAIAFQEISIEKEPKKILKPAPNRLKDTFALAETLNGLIHFLLGHFSMQLAMNKIPKQDISLIEKQIQEIKEIKNTKGILNNVPLMEKSITKLSIIAKKII